MTIEYATYRGERVQVFERFTVAEACRYCGGEPIDCPACRGTRVEPKRVRMASVGFLEGEWAGTRDNVREDALNTGRVKLSELGPGERYYAVYTSTGMCCYKTRSLAEAEQIVAKNPDKLEWRQHNA